MEKTKLTVNLSDDVTKTLRSLADEQGVTLTEILRRAISMESFLNKEVKEGHKILIEDKKGRLRQILVR